MCEFMTVSEAQCLYIYHELRSFYISMGSRISREEGVLAAESDRQSQKLVQLLMKAGVMTPDIHSMESRKLFAAVAQAQYDLTAIRINLSLEERSHVPI